MPPGWRILGDIPQGFHLQNGTQFIPTADGFAKIKLRLIKSLTRSTCSVLEVQNLLPPLLLPWSRNRVLSLCTISNNSGHKWLLGGTGGQATPEWVLDAQRNVWVPRPQDSPENCHHWVFPSQRSICFSEEERNRHYLKFCVFSATRTPIKSVFFVKT